MSNTALFKEALAAGEGVVRLAPCWVPRSFLMPGGRLKLDPRDLYALGAHRGGIDERWFSSTTKAANGPLTIEDEGLSYIEFNGKKALLKEGIDTLGDRFLGAEAAGKSTRASCMHPAPWLPTSRKSTPMSSPCINRSSKAASCRGICWSK